MLLRICYSNALWNATINNLFLQFLAIFQISIKDGVQNQPPSDLFQNCWVAPVVKIIDKYFPFEKELILEVYTEPIQLFQEVFLQMFAKTIPWDVLKALTILPKTSTCEILQGLQFAFAFFYTNSSYKRTTLLKHFGNKF